MARLLGAGFAALALVAWAAPASVGTLDDTAAHALILAALWLMVRRRFLFTWCPADRQVS